MILMLGDTKLGARSLEMELESLVVPVANASIYTRT
jgi:hypothetical protein